MIQIKTPNLGESVPNKSISPRQVELPNKLQIADEIL